MKKKQRKRERMIAWEKDRGQIYGRDIFFAINSTRVDCQREKRKRAAATREA